MPNPKRRHSTTRRDKRRTHYKAVAPTIATDKTTGEVYLSHRAYWSTDGKLIYNGQTVMERSSK
jgi:large subunit ribosomal protein L32